MAKTQFAPIPNPPPGPTHGPPKIIYAGLMRMGSLSTAHAFATLGYRTHHGLETGLKDVRLFSHAADATWPDKEASNRDVRPYSREQWDEIFETYNCITDVGSWFAPQLIEAYPEVKVVLVQRDFDKWWESIDSEVIKPNFPNNVALVAFIHTLAYMADFPPDTMQKILKGWFDAQTYDQVKANARRKYDEHFARMRRMVPAERLLEFRLQDGWEPLCQFLGKDVPDVPFPRINDRKEHRQRAIANVVVAMTPFWHKLRPWLFGSIGVVVIGVALGIGRVMGLQ